MEQRRHTPRAATLKEAQIVLATGEALPCTVEDISCAGVRLKVDAAAVPVFFDLVFSEDGECCRCRTVWRNPDRVGAAFVADAKADQMARAR